MSDQVLKVDNGLLIVPVNLGSSPQNGEIQYDINSNQFKFYQNGSWVTIPSSFHSCSHSSSFS